MIEILHQGSSLPERTLRFPKLPNGQRDGLWTAIWNHRLDEAGSAQKLSKSALWGHPDVSDVYPCQPQITCHPLHSFPISEIVTNLTTA